MRVYLVVSKVISLNWQYWVNIQCYYAKYWTTNLTIWSHWCPLQLGKCQTPLLPSKATGELLYKNNNLANGWSAEWMSAISVTRFGEILPFDKILQVFWQSNICGYVFFCGREKAFHLVDPSIASFRTPILMHILVMLREYSSWRIWSIKSMGKGPLDDTIF